MVDLSSETEVEELHKMRKLQSCVEEGNPLHLERGLYLLNPRDINMLIAQDSRELELGLGRTLLMGPILNQRFEMIAVLLRHGADPFAPVKRFQDSYGGDISTSNALEQCLMHACSDPTPFVFILRLMDRRPPEKPLEETPCFQIRPGPFKRVVWPNSYEYIGRYVDAPLTATNQDEDQYRACRTALMFACEHHHLFCVKWLLEVRGANPAVQFTLPNRRVVDALSIAVDQLEKSRGKPYQDTCEEIVQLLLHYLKMKGAAYAARPEPYHHVLSLLKKRKRGFDDQTTLP